MRWLSAHSSRGSENERAERCFAVLTIEVIEYGVFRAEFFFTCVHFGIDLRNCLACEGRHIRQESGRQGAQMPASYFVFVCKSGHHLDL